MALRVVPRIDARRHTVTLEEYERMVAAGVFAPEARLELIRGEIVDMPPIGPEHETAVTRLHLLFFEHYRRRAVVWPQGNSLGLPQSNSRPQPDITILHWRADLYAGKRPGPEDVILLVEVADSTLKLDRGGKLPLYAAAGIPEYWVVNLVDGVVEVYTDPQAGKYLTARTARRDETLPLPGGLEGGIAVGDIL
ncbi:MAG TPA: Uma2 family endonuclease [Chloroflexia bacterium]|nr:Uma2 family endonuclease [Chloroflexia bacterium]